jgi:hypothetical protein
MTLAFCCIFVCCHLQCPKSPFWSNNRTGIGFGPANTVHIEISSIYMLSATIRFLALGTQAGVAAWMLSAVLMCIGGCGGYEEVLYATMFGVFVAVSTIALLMVGHANASKSDPQSLEIQAKLQWGWLIVSTVVLVLAS